MRKRLRPHRRFRFSLIRWHRRIGVTVSLLVIWLACSGILLNHSDDFNFDDRSVDQPLLLAIYGIERPEPVSYFQAGRWFSHLGGNQLYVDGLEAAYCQPPLSGVVWLNQQFVAACGDGLLLMTEQGEVIEQLGSAYGLPDTMTALAVVGEQLLIKGDTDIQQGDLERLQWSPYQQEEDIVGWSAPSQAPDELLETLQPLIGSELNWERVLLDLHSGRLGGALGRWIMDIAAVLLLLLAASGVWIWARR